MARITELDARELFQAEITLDVLSDRLTARYFGVTMTQRGRDLIMPFFEHIHPDDVYKAFTIALERMDKPEAVIQYAVGILRNWRDHGVDDGSLTKRVVK